MNNTITAQIAKHFRELHFGGNWTCSNLKDNLANVTWQQAIQKVHSFNTIATLVYHMHYYVNAQITVLKGGNLDGVNDEFSFKHPPINSQNDWEDLLNKVWTDAETAASLIEALPDEKLLEDFTAKKYGIYYRQLHGNIEHLHYHLGQIALIKKLVMTH